MVWRTFQLIGKSCPYDVQNKPNSFPQAKFYWWHKQLGAHDWSNDLQLMAYGPSFWPTQNIRRSTCCCHNVLLVGHATHSAIKKSPQKYVIVPCVAWKYRYTLFRLREIGISLLDACLQSIFPFPLSFSLSVIF